jgi:adenylate kinase
VLDGFPQTLEQAQKLFKAELKEGEEPEAEDAPAEDPPEGEEEDAPPIKIKVDDAVFPSFVVSLECTEEVARQRFKDLPEAEVVADHNDEDGFDRRWARYEYVMNPEAEVIMSPMGFFKHVEILEIPLESTVNVDSAQTAINSYMSKGGKPFNFHPTPEEEEAKRSAEESKQKEQAEAKRQELEIREKDERKERLQREQADKARKAQVLRDDQELVDSCSLPLRKYLMTNVIPPLVEGLLEVCKAKPDDPIDYLSEYLFKVSVGVPEQDTPDESSASATETTESSS